MNDAEKIRQRMQMIRSEIGGDVEQIVEEAKTLVDWREYVKRAPLATTGLAFALGFLLVPWKSRSVTPVFRLGEKEVPIPFASAPVDPPRKSAASLGSVGMSLAGSLMPLAAKFLLAKALTQLTSDASDSPSPARRARPEHSQPANSQADAYVPKPR